MAGNSFSSNKSIIGNGSQGNFVIQDSNVDKLIVVENTDLVKMFSEMERFDLVNKHILKMVESATRSHPLYPDYGVKINHDISRLISSPMTLEAINKNPKKIKGTFLVDYAKYPHMKRDENPWEYAYRTQTPVDFETTSYKEYLGDIIDPYPIMEFEDGMKTRIFPPPFPPPVEGIVTSGEISIPVLLQRKPCMDYGKLIIGTVTDNCGFELSVSKYEGTNKTEITISRVHGCDLPVQLQREKLINSLSRTRHLIITIGSLTFFDATFEEDALNQGIFHNENIVKYIKSLIEIEERINCKFKKDIEDFTFEDFKVARILSSSLNDKWHSFKSDFDDEIRVDHNKFFLDDGDLERENVEIRAELDVTEIVLHGLKFTADKYLVLFKNARVNNIDSIRKNINRRRRNILVTFRPVDGKAYFVKYCKFEGVKLVPEDVK